MKLLLQNRQTEARAQIPAIRKLLRWLIAHSPELRQLDPWSEIVLIFTNDVGKFIDLNHWRKRVFHKALEKAKLRKIRIHDLRHTFASLLIDDGASLVYIKEQLGHASIKTTVDVYGHLIKGGNKGAVDKLDDQPLHPFAPQAHPDAKNEKEAAAISAATS